MTTDDQIRLMEHTLGGKSPFKWYRNHFVASENHTDFENLSELEKQEFMKRTRTPSFCDSRDIVFSVTNKGQLFLAERYSKSTRGY